MVVILIFSNNLHYWQTVNADISIGLTVSLRAYAFPAFSIIRSASGERTRTMPSISECF